jgi:CRISPR-associated protein Cas1
MSWHILHILSHSARLKKYRGHLQLIKDEQRVQQIPLEDLKCVVLASRGISLSSNVLSALLEHKVGIVHCDNTFVPCGMTMPLTQTIHPKILERQITAPKLKEKLWQKILRQKIKNQAQVLELMGADASYLQSEAQKKLLNESAAARQYFQGFFTCLGEVALTRREEGGHVVNVMLNYGYAVVQALVHRSLVAHGLSPIHGLHHKDRYQADALVYDLIEPWRPFLDLMVWVFCQKNTKRDFSDFKKYIGFSQHSWQTLRFSIDCKKSLKMINCIDFVSSSLANAFLCQKENQLWLPEVESNHFTDLLKWDGVL